MADNGALGQVQQVAAFERVLREMQRGTGQTLRAARESAGLSLREVAQHVCLTYQGLLNIESGKSWRTPTVLRVAEFYSKLGAATDTNFLESK